MKKLIFTMLFISGISTTQAQFTPIRDTSYRVNNGTLWMKTVEYKELDKSLFMEQYKSLERRKKGQRRFVAVVGTIFAGLTAWYFIGVSR